MENSLVQRPLRQDVFVVAINAAFITGDRDASSSGMPQMTDEEEEAQAEVRCSKPTPRRDEVDAIHLRSYASDGVQRAKRCMRHVFRSPSFLPRLDAGLQFTNI